MLIHIQHRTELSYSSRTSESVMELRMTPRTTARQNLRGFCLAVGPSATLIEHVDWLGNRVHQLSLVAAHDRILILAESCVETQPAEHLDLGTQGGVAPIVLEDHRLLDFTGFEGPINRDPRLATIAQGLGITPGMAVGEIVTKLQFELGRVVEYKKGITSSQTSVAAVLDRGAGVCQDLSHVAIALFRSLGIPARYISGYLHSSGATTEVETHAWVEAYVPGVGFVALDPTHASTVGEGHIAVAVGRSFADVPPNRGVYRGDASEAIAVSVATEEVHEVPKGLLVPRSASIEMATPADALEAHREGLDYQQEQAQQQQQQQQQ